MSIEISNGSALGDAELLLEVRALARDERQATARLIAVLGEVDARRLYLAEGCSSLFTYCTQVLHFSEHAAYGRIEAARAARKWPALLKLLADGSVHLTAVTLLAPYLTMENHRELVAAAQHKSKREIEEIVAALRPRPPVLSSVRKLPVPKAAPVVPSPPAGFPAAERAVADAGTHGPMPPLRRQEFRAEPLNCWTHTPANESVQFADIGAHNGPGSDSARSGPSW